MDAMPNWLPVLRHVAALFGESDATCCTTPRSTTSSVNATLGYQNTLSISPKCHCN